MSRELTETDRQFRQTLTDRDRQRQRQRQRVILMPGILNIRPSVQRLYMPERKRESKSKTKYKRVERWVGVGVGGRKTQTHKRIKKNDIYYDKTQHVKFRGTKPDLNQQLKGARFPVLPEQ